jgi:DNA invertase Pin-like site-specific DNA recombinase
MTATRSETLPASVLGRKAVVYVRQSTQAQVETNTESQRRQYELVEVARGHGFKDVTVIDDDLGRSASGTVARPGFDRLVAWLCAGEVGAVLCFDASRLARNGRDWQHLLELCGLVEARVIDTEGVYDPCRPNDRLLLGMKGTISEFETGVIRARMLDAAWAKARRGELRIGVPIGYAWHRELGLGFDPDLRVQEAVRVIFARFRELGSARQVLLALTAEGMHFPRPADGRKLTQIEWTPIRYRNVISVLKNPFYAGVYVYGKSEKRTEIVDGRVRKSYGHARPRDAWEVVLKDHHESYIDWAEYERNQAQLAANAYGKTGGTKSGRGGQALLAGVPRSTRRSPWTDRSVPAQRCRPRSMNASRSAGPGHHRRAPRRSEPLRDRGRVPASSRRSRRPDRRPRASFGRRHTSRPLRPRRIACANSDRPAAAGCDGPCTTLFGSRRQAIPTTSCRTRRSMTSKSARLPETTWSTALACGAGACQRSRRTAPYTSRRSNPRCPGDYATGTLVLPTRTSGRLDRSASEPAPGMLGRPRLSRTAARN